MQEVAEDWLVFVLTGSPFLLGVVSFCKAPSRILLAPVFGAIIDRIDRKRILIGMYAFQLVLTLVFAFLVTTKIIQFWHIVVLGILDGVVAPLIRVTRQTVVPDLVPRESLINAISLNSVGNRSSHVIGPFLGGILIAWIGIEWVFYINAISFAALIICFTALKIPAKRGELGRLDIRRDIGEGLRFIRNNPPILDMMTMQCICFLFAFPFSRLFPVYAKEILMIGPTGLGLLKGCFAGGSVLGGLGLISFREVKDKERLLKVTALAMTLSLILFSHAFWLPLSLTCLVLIGITAMVFQTTALSVIQLTVPDQFRGRVMGLYNLAAGFRSVGGLLYGSSASLIGTPITVAMGGAIFGLISYFTRCAPKSGMRGRH